MNTVIVFSAAVWQQALSLHQSAHSSAYIPRRSECLHTPFFTIQDATGTKTPDASSTVRGEQIKEQLVEFEV